jgi:hypothetical protein
LDHSAPATVTQSASEAKHMPGQIDADQGSGAQTTSLFPRRGAHQDRAMACKFIILDIRDATTGYLLGLAAITLALGATYRLMRERNDP